MKRMLTATAAAVIALAGLSGAAVAQPRHDDRHDNHGPQGPQGHNWRKGDRINHNDWHRYQSVDWRSHHLRQPPRGYEWREVNGQYVMAAAATGLVAAIIMANH
jgi:Ni/Co efflux regulator RcnB